MVVTSLEALGYRILPKKTFVDSLELLQAGEEVARDRLIRKLEINGYERCSLVEERGDYSVAGGAS